MKTPRRLEDEPDLPNAKAQDWPHPKPISPRDWLRRSLEDSQPGFDAELVACSRERLRDTKLDKDWKAMTNPRKGIKVLDYIDDRSGRMQDDIKTLEELSRYPTWRFSFAAFTLHGFIIPLNESDAAISRIHDKGERTPEEEHVMATYLRLRRDFPFSTEKSPETILQAASYWSGPGRPTAPFFLWAMLGAMQREYARRSRLIGLWKQRKRVLEKHRIRAANRSELVRLKAYVWVLAKKRWPQHEGNQAAMAGALKQLLKSEISHNASAISSENATAILSEGEQAVSSHRQGTSSLKRKPSSKRKSSSEAEPGLDRSSSATDEPPKTTPLEYAPSKRTLTNILKEGSAQLGENSTDGARGPKPILQK